MKRKLLSVFLSLAMVLTMMPVFAMAEDTSLGGGTKGADSGSNVEASGINSYDALVKAISGAEDGATITLAGDIDVTKTIRVENKTITLNLAGHRLYNSEDIWNDNDWSLISVRGTADLTISGEGELQAKVNDCYGVDVYDKTATVTIKKANVIGNVHAVYVVEGTANIEGGNYSVQQKYPDPNKADEFVLNLYDESRENGIAKMVVTGGTFENFNPANCKAEGTGTNFCAIGYTTENSGSKYTVVEGTNTAVANAGVNYNTVSNAIGSYTHVNKMVVTLLSDIKSAIKEDVTVPSKKNITLDLNGNTLTNVSNNTITIENGAELTVTGNGTVDNTTHGKSAIYNKGTATLKSGTFDRSKETGKNAEESGGNSYYTVLNHGKMTVEPGVTVNNKGGYSSLFENGYYNYKTQDGIEFPELTINGGTFTGGINTIKNDDNATLTIKDGTFKNYTQSAFQNHHIAIIDGGTFDGANVYAVLNCGGCSSVVEGHDNHETTITGGKFNGTISQTVGKITISGGLFSKEFDKSYCETGLTIIDNTDDSTKANYPKTVGTIKASNNGEIREESVKGTDDKKVSPAISGKENRDAAEVIVNSVEIPSNEEIKDNTTITEDDKARAVTALVENNKLALDNGKIPENTTVTVVKETYLEVELTDLNMNNGTNNPTVTMNITPKYNLIAKVESAGKKEFITIKPAQNATVTAPTKVSVTLPNTFAGKKVYITHKNDIYVAIADKEGNIEFTTNGFSPFTFALSDPSVVAEVNGNAYTSLQAAVDAAVSGSTIEIVGGETSKEYTATMTGSTKTITVKNSTTAEKITVKVNGDSEDIAKDKTVDFTYTRHSSSGSSTTTYTVTVGSVSNGTVTSSHKSAASGATVTLTVKPADGYAVEAVTAKDAKGNAVKVTEKDGKYTFAMPASNVTVSASFIKKGEQPAAKLFNDVAQGAYYYDAVKWAVDKGVTNGKTSNLFGSEDPCTRAQIVTFLWRAAESPAASASVSFTDVKDSDYYAKAVAWAVEKGITNGTGDGKFSSDETCTRAQCAAFLYRAAGSPEVTDAAAFSDVAADAYYAKAVAWAEKNGITNGLGNGKFGSDNSCTRAQIITFLYRTYQGK